MTKSRRYQYGVALTNSGLASNDLLQAEIYPDATDSLDRVTYTYNRQGQRTTRQDQNGWCMPIRTICSDARRPIR